MAVTFDDRELFVVQLGRAPTPSWLFRGPGPRRDTALAWLESFQPEVDAATRRLRTDGPASLAVHRGARTSLERVDLGEAELSFTLAGERVTLAFDPARNAEVRRFFAVAGRPMPQAVLLADHDRAARAFRVELASLRAVEEPVDPVRPGERWLGSAVLVEGVLHGVFASDRGPCFFRGATRALLEPGHVGKVLDEGEWRTFELRHPAQATVLVRYRAPPPVCDPWGTEATTDLFAWLSEALREPTFFERFFQS